MTALRPSNSLGRERQNGCWPTKATTVRPSSIISRRWEQLPSYLPSPIANNSALTTKNSIENETASSDASPGSNTSAASPLATKSSNRTSKLSSPSHALGCTYSYMSIRPSADRISFSFLARSGSPFILLNAALAKLHRHAEIKPNTANPRVISVRGGPDFLSGGIARSTT